MKNITLGSILFGGFMALYTVAAVAGVPIGPGEGVNAEVRQVYMQNSAQGNVITTRDGRKITCPPGSKAATFAPGQTLGEIANGIRKPGEPRTVADIVAGISRNSGIPDTNDVRAGEGYCLPPPSNYR